MQQHGPKRTGLLGLVKCIVDQSTLSSSSFVGHAMHCCGHLEGCDLKQMVRSLKNFQSPEPVWVRENALQHLPFICQNNI